MDSNLSSNYRRHHPWTRTSGTRGDFASGLQLGLEPTTQALEIQRFNHYAMERSNKESTSLCIYYQLSWLAWRKKNWNIWLEIAFHLCFNNHEAIQQDCLWLCPFQNYCWCKIHVQTNSFINALRQKWGLPEFVRIRGFCSIETSQSTTTSSQHKRPSLEFHKILSLFAKRGSCLIRCSASINVGLQNDAVL